LSELTSDQSAGHKRLLRGALLIAKLDDPDVDVDAYVQRVDEMADEVRSGLAEDADSIARREALHRYLFDENGFRGGLSEYYHPANSHLNRVIDDREGLPITLSLLYMELGQRIGITIEGVGLPGHFIVNHVIDDERQQLVDVFDRGRLLSRDDAQEIVATYARRKMTDRDLRAQTVVEILSRVLNNLVGVASRRQDIESIHRYCEALVAISPGSVQSRMMRAQIRAMAQRREGAIADLDWLIEKDPPGFDRTRAFELRQSLIGRGE
jgi:regulator of sirC expression with transglutaminase-like and TPR domain